MRFLWTFFIVDTNTGVRQLKVFPAAGSWRRVINGAGSGSHSFRLRTKSARAVGRAGWRALTQPWARTLVVCWAGVPVYAGIIQGRNWDTVSGTLTVQHSEVRSIFSRRHPFGVNAYETGTLTVTNRSLRGALRAVIMAGAGLGSWRWNLPFVYPDDEAGTYSKTWSNFSFPLIEEMISDIQDLDGGPDIDFRPQWAADGSLQWAVRIGSPRLAYNVFEWQASAPQSGVTELSVTEDASKQLTGVLTIGEGSEAAIKWGRAPESAGSQIPYLDTSRPYTSESSQANLDSFARAELATYREPTTQYEMTVLAPQYPGANELVPGSTVRLGVTADEFLDDGFKSLYLLGLSGDMSAKLKLEVQGV